MNQLGWKPFTLAPIENLGPLGSLLFLTAIIGGLFLIIIMLLDASKNFELKRDWRKKDSDENL